VKRHLFVEQIDEAIEKLSNDCVADFDNCADKIEIMKVKARYAVKLKALSEKRLLAKYAMHEESELVYQLTKMKEPEKKS
jgi:hypothetical protein